MSINREKKGIVSSVFQRLRYQPHLMGSTATSALVRMTKRPNVALMSQLTNAMCMNRMSSMSEAESGPQREDRSIVMTMAQLRLTVLKSSRLPIPCSRVNTLMKARMKHITFTRSRLFLLQSKSLVFI